jgi:hypothetical protein
MWRYTVPIYTFLCVSLALISNLEVHGSNLHVRLCVSGSELYCGGAQFQSIRYSACPLALSCNVEVHGSNLYVTLRVLWL